MLALQPSPFRLPAPRPTIAVLRSAKLPIPSVSTACRCHFQSSEPPDEGDPRTTLGSLTVTAVFLALGFQFASGALVRPPPVALASARGGFSSVHPEEARSGDSGDTSFRMHVSKADDDEAREEERENVSVEDRKLEEAFEQWKSKSYALTVPLTVVSLRGAVPPSWIKDFLASQGKRVRLQFKLNDSLEGIFSNLSTAFNKGNVKSTSPAAADVVSIGDSWLLYAIKNGLVEPINGAEDQVWFSQLSDRWKTYLCRNSEGVAALDGEVWAAPYRWGCMVIAYKKSKFEKLGLDPIEDWKDLWRPELRGRISTVDCPREVMGIVLKYMGFSYNTDSLDSSVSGGTIAIQKNLALLAKQVRLFDSRYYLKAFGVDDVWVAIGWSSDVVPAAKRLRNIAVIVPKSGASLWADLWVIPSTAKLKDCHQVGGRMRGPSPLIHQWMEFCTQPARALPFHQGVLPGAIPSALNGLLPRENAMLTKGQPKLESNLVAGVPPPEILSRCEFLEPLSDATMAEYDRLIRTMQRPGYGFMEQWRNRLALLVQTIGMKLHAKGMA